MKKDYIFLLGRPGCGKSFVYETVIKKLGETENIEKTERVDDFPILKELLDKDTEFKRHVRKEGGFEVTDFTIVDEVLSTIDSRLEDVKSKNDLVFIEFARDNYISALKNFRSETFAKAMIVYIYCPYDVCLARNRKRFEQQKNNALDDHIVPTDLMESYYKNDDIEKIYLEDRSGLDKVMPGDFFVMDNSSEGLEVLLGQFDALIKELK
ncbi:MAG: hypothetical protein U9O97_02435 [Elusimicrobiota bacterium]|nr:hypothetical protein [Elusimicrobiota bacterium]